MTAALIALAIIGLVLLVVLIFMVLRIKVLQTRDIEMAVSSSWRELGLDRTLGAVETHARDIKESYRSFEQMLRVPKERGALGELSLETMLADQLPADMFGIRERVLDGKTPDANIKSTVGLICIDSKFPLVNYSKMVETDNTNEKEAASKDFVRDVRNHLDKICEDYVCPEKGSAEFAFAYIPSEAVYYFLVNDAFETMRNYAKRGVQVVSPLTFAHKIELIKAGVHAKKLSEDAEKVKQQLTTVAKGFDTIDREWHTFYETHFNNAVKKAVNVDEAYKKLRDEFNRISKLPGE
ncbi:MAG: DNA recombination protein RmuC [Chloroflexota bacterium]